MSITKKNRSFLEALNLPEKRRLLAELLQKKATTFQEYPLSFAQERLWFLDQFQEQSATYNMLQALQLRGQLNITVLVDSCNAIIRRHAVLRTNFRSNPSGKPVAVVAPKLHLSVPVINKLGATPQAIQAFLNQQIDTPFNLAEGPLLRLFVIQTAAKEFVLILVIHHIIFDGVSGGIWIKELAALYNAFIANQPSPLAPITLQYHQFADWQRHQYSIQSEAPQLAYWQQKLAGAPPFLQLPTDKNRPALQTYNGDIYRHTLDPILSQAVKNLSQQANVTRFSTLQSAFFILLSLYSQQKDIVIGTPVANRDRVELESLLGFFVNLLPLRQDLSDNPSVLEFLGRVQQATRQALVHQALPFEQLVSLLEPERNTGYAPIFQVAIGWVPVQHNTCNRFAGLHVTPLMAERTTAKLDITLFVADTAAGLRCTWEYNSDLFQPGTIQCMADRLDTVLRAMHQTPMVAIQALSLLTMAEIQKLQAWNDTSKFYKEDLTLIDLFETQVEHTPNSPAITYQDQTLTYRQLNARANQVAHYLQSLTTLDGQTLIQPDTLVGICVERSLAMVIGLLGILKAGAAYVPLDPDYPLERLQYMLADSQIIVLLTQEKLQHTVLFSISHPIQQMVLLDHSPVFKAQSTHNPALSAHPHHLAYVLYTSGSTGKPKGVMVEHRNTVALINWVQTTANPTHFQGILASTSLNFDLSVYELFGTWGVGGQVLLVQNALALSVQPSQYPVTLINTVPTVITELLRTGTIPRSVKVINLAGEPLQPTLVQALYKLPHIEAIYNLYGPSEDTTYSTGTRIAKGGQSLLSIGQPIANTRVYILNAQHQPQPIGIPGELCLAGAGLARGYLNQPELTAEKFIALELFGKTERVYKTGDLARWLSDGNLEYLGRLDHQIKLRGFRVELGEIETVLMQHDTVNEAVVVMRESETNPALAAYLTASEHSVLDSLGVRDWLKTQLPDYMVPSTFTLLDSLPLTPNGKIDRKTLPEPDRLAFATAFVAPDTAALKLIAGIWRTLLDIDQVGIYDNFFSLGGHSLLVTQLVFQLQTYFYVTVPLTEVFANPTLAGLMTVLSTLHGTRETVETIAETWGEMA